MTIDYKQLYAIKKSNTERIFKLCPQVNNQSGIYCFFRNDDTFKYCYIGKAINLLDRLSSHLNGYKQHIDISLLKRKLYDENSNTQGWQIKILSYCNENELDTLESKYIAEYGNNGWQMPYNKNSGGMAGKSGINDNKSTKTYTQGKLQGYNNCRKDIAKLFEKNLTYGINGASNKNKEKALEKLKIFLDCEIETEISNEKKLK